MHFTYFKNYIYLFKTVFIKQKWKILFLTALGFVNGMLDSVGIVALIPLFAIVAKDSSSRANRISDLIGSFFSYVGLELNLYTILFFMALIFVTKAIGEFIVGYIRTRITTQYEKDIRVNLYRKTLMAQWPYLMRQKIGHLENILMNDVHGTSGLFNRICNIAPSFASFVVYLGVALKTSASITLMTLGVGLVIIVFTKPVSARIKYYVTKITAMNKAIAHRVNENVQGMKMIKALAIQDDIVKSEESVFEGLRQMWIKSAVMKQLSTGFIEPITFIFIAFVFSYSYSKPGFSIGSFVVVMYLIQKLFQSVNRLQGSLIAVSESMAYAHNVIGLDTAVIEHEEQDHGSESFKMDRELEFRNVTFGYRQDKLALTDVSFIIQKNEMVGIIGPSGAGKTTIADLMLRLFDPMKGEILMDGKHIADMKLDELRRNVGYVSQDIFLKNETVENNIVLYMPGVTEKEIIKAAKMANIYDFITDLPNGFQTIIGDRGVLLSGGQRQRIVLARTLVRKPKILILDEATSALDNESEFLIRKSIESLKGGVTVVIIAHRLSTIMNCDRLIVLDNGRIVEGGTPADLLNDQESYFYKVHHLQSES